MNLPPLAARILVVEDDRNLARLLTDLLGARGHAAGLEGGADDDVARTAASSHELLARIGALLRRSLATARDGGRATLAAGDLAIDVHVAALSRKLGDDPRAPRYIHTVRAAGSRLVDGEPAGSRA
jgi:DNA-binding response OmpR family regulator